MPLSKETRYLLEVALIGYLKTNREATSSEIYEHYKQRGFLAIKGVKQVSMICRAYEKKGVLLSRKPNLSNIRPEIRKLWRVRKWRINPNFYKEHKGQRMFSIQIGSCEEERIIRKRRMSAMR
jgi:hypothetical protein